MAASRLTEEALRELLHFVLWTEAELTHILCGIAPPAIIRSSSEKLPTPIEKLSHAERHVGDAIARGELRCEPRLGDKRIAEALRDRIQDTDLAADIELAVRASRMYEQRRLRPEDAVKWALSRKGMFPDSPLKEEHFHLVLRAGLRSAPAGGDHERDRLEQRAKWLKDHMDRKALSLEAIKAQEGPDRKTIKKILQAQPVSENVLNRLALALKVARSSFP